MAKKHPFTVRKMVNGYNGEVKWNVYYKGGRVNVHAFPSREGAQENADALNILELVAPADADGRPFEVRHAEAAAAYRAQGKPLIDLID